MSKTQRSTVWAMVNWANIQNNIVTKTSITPDQANIEEAITQIEKAQSEDQLFLMEAEELEKLLVDYLTKLLFKNRGKEIKKKLANREKEERQKQQNVQDSKVGVQIMPFGNMKDMKDLGLDPEMMEQISKSMMDQLFGKRSKKKDDDDEDDEDPGASFYM